MAMNLKVKVNYAVGHATLFSAVCVALVPPAQRVHYTVVGISSEKCMAAHLDII